MAAMPETLAETTEPVRTHKPVAPARRGAAARPVLSPWLRAQSINVTRHAAALRPFRRDEFGTGAAAPSDGHIQAVNELLKSLRTRLLSMSKKVTDAARSATEQPDTPKLQRLVTRKERAHIWVQGIERIWDFYFELFGQRQSTYPTGCSVATGSRLIAIKWPIPDLAQRDRYRRRRRFVTCALVSLRPHSGARFRCGGSANNSTRFRLFSCRITAW